MERICPKKFNTSHQGYFIHIWFMKNVVHKLHHFCSQKMLTYTWFQFVFHANVHYRALMVGGQNREIHIVLYMWTCCINLIWECSKHLWTSYETFYLQIIARCSWSWINICLKPRQNHVFQNFMCQTLTKRDNFSPNENFATFEHRMYGHLFVFNEHLILLTSYESWGDWKLVFFILIMLFQVPKNITSYGFFLVWVQVIVPCMIKLFEAPIIQFIMQFLKWYEVACFSKEHFEMSLL